MGFFVKVIPPSHRARIHEGACKHCRDGRGQEHQQIGGGPTYWQPAHPTAGYSTVAEARAFMGSLGPRYTDIGLCAYCMRGQADT